MKEIDVIDQTPSPISKNDLIRDLKALGLSSKDHVIIHVSMSKIGWIIGGEVTLLQTLQSFFDEGTIVMVTQTGDLSDPRNWENPPVPSSWTNKIIENMPTYDKYVTPPNRLGRLPRLFYNAKDVYRSDHPMDSFAAWGKRAEEVTSFCDYHCAFGDKSPIQYMIDHDFKMLMIGTSYDTATVLHYAETKVKHPPRMKQLLFINDEHGQRHVLEVEDIDYDTIYFNEIGQDYEKYHHIQKGFMGQAETKVVDVKSLVQHGVTYLRNKERQNA